MDESDQVVKHEPSVAPLEPEACLVAEPAECADSDTLLIGDDVAELPTTSRFGRAVTLKSSTYELPHAATFVGDTQRSTLELLDLLYRCYNSPAVRAILLNVDRDSQDCMSALASPSAIRAASSSARKVLAQKSTPKSAPKLAPKSTQKSAQKSAQKSVKKSATKRERVLPVEVDETVVVSSSSTLSPQHTSSSRVTLDLSPAKTADVDVADESLPAESVLAESVPAESAQLVESAPTPEVQPSLESAMVITEPVAVAESRPPLDTRQLAELGISSDVAEGMDEATLRLIISMGATTGRRRQSAHANLNTNKLAAESQQKQRQQAREAKAEAKAERAQAKASSSTPRKTPQKRAAPTPTEKVTPVAPPASKKPRTSGKSTTPRAASSAAKRTSRCATAVVAVVEAAADDADEKSSDEAQSEAESEAEIADEVLSSRARAPRGSTSAEFTSAISDSYSGHSLGYGEMSRGSVSQVIGALVEGRFQPNGPGLRFIDIGSGAGRPTMHAALGFAHCIAKSDGIELGFHRFVTSLEILDHVRERMQLPLTHINYLQGDAGCEKTISFDDYDTFFFYDAVVSPADKARIFRRIGLLKHEVRLFCNTSVPEMDALGVPNLQLRMKLQTRGQNGKNNFVGFIYDKPRLDEHGNAVKTEASAQ